MHWCTDCAFLFLRQLARPYVSGASVPVKTLLNSGLLYPHSRALHLKSHVEVSENSPMLRHLPYNELLSAHRYGRHDEACVCITHIPGSPIISHGMGPAISQAEGLSHTHSLLVIIIKSNDAIASRLLNFITAHESSSNATG